jgi:GNAT superfamily N-acetyltransferase
VDPSALQEFFRQMFPARAGLLGEHWRWMYRVDDVPEVMPPLVAVDQGQVIGQYAQIPVLLGRGDVRLQAVWGVDYGVLPAYRHSGIGWELMDRWLHQYPVHMGFATEAAFRIALKQGWKPRCTTCDLRLPLRLDHHPRARKGVLGGPLQAVSRGWNLLMRLGLVVRQAGAPVLHETPLSAERLRRWSLLSYPGRAQDALHIPRTASYLKWRYLDSPWREQYRILESADTGLAVMVRLFDTGPGRTARILSVSGHIDERGLLHRFLGDVIRWACDRSSSLVHLVSSDPGLVAVARRWFPIRSWQRFVYYCNDPAGDDQLDSSEHIWELMDSDFDFLQ